LAILLAGAWAVYTFVYKEIIIPMTAPINLTMDLELKRIDQIAAGVCPAPGRPRLSQPRARRPPAATPRGRPERGGPSAMYSVN
jgi:hypothetical protein